MRTIQAKSILGNHNNMNIYRGCTHGCIYCDSRSLCYGIDDFTNIIVKANAIELLRTELQKKRQKAMICTGSMSDPYNPLEAQLEMTKKSLEVIKEYGFGALVLTKSDLVLRDLQLFKAINQNYKAILQMTITTFDDELCKKIEPQTALTSRRFQVLEEFVKNGIEIGVWLSPILPFVNDTKENIHAIVDKCHQIGVTHIVMFNMGLTLRDGNRAYFYQQLDRLFPGLKQQYIQLYHQNYECLSIHEQELNQLFFRRCEELGILTDISQIFKTKNNYKKQLFFQDSLFDKK